MSLTARVLIGLVLGFVLGLVAMQVPALASVPGWIEPLGTIFINAIRMTVLPLVVSSLIVGVASAPDTRTVGRLGGRAIVMFTVLVLVSAIIGVLVAPLGLAVNPPDVVAATGLQTTTGPGADLIARAKEVPTFAQWLTGLIPTNPIRAASEGAMLPLIVFSLLFGVALTRVDEARRAPLLRALSGLQDATFVLVRWVLLAAPIGVFALAAPLAARFGLKAAGALVWYSVFVSLLCIAFMALVLYPVAIIGGRVTLREFARAALPVQLVAMSTRSSMAALPVMIEQMGGKLGLGREITGFLIPLSASMFRAGAGIGIATGTCFLAALYGIDLNASQLMTVALTTTLLSFSIPGIPNGSIIAMVPVLIAAGVPVEGVGILIAVDVIPDMFRTTTNATGTMAVATVLGARTRVPVPAST